MFDMDPILQFISDYFVQLVALLNLVVLLLYAVLRKNFDAHQKLDVRLPSLRIFLWIVVPVLTVASWYSSFVGVFNLTVFLLILSSMLRANLFCEVAEEQAALTLSLIKIKKSKLILSFWLQGLCYMVVGGLSVWLSNGGWGEHIGMGIALYGLKIGSDSTRHYWKIYKKYKTKNV